ncbi:uncharacterized protein LOC118466621 [Anopheles albimanus]|uniref:uncharacterized protein LOC118466621 n=1 Tax=Anopheles albimanus TaxID=7167 RepID=UPI00164149A2|nr:uncharacterized protein LOC118466621 [Anopheles albimanus]XP_035792099.1 uncharacterized protein LOC118466621 [Anopheles albimanus]XP_035792100.1 uncharacterized protein LOC118466621 [Anopheles albimanus]
MSGFEPYKRPFSESTRRRRLKKFDASEIINRINEKYTDEEFWQLVNEKLGESSRRTAQQVELEEGTSVVQANQDQEENVVEDSSDQEYVIEEPLCDSSSDEETIDEDSNNVESWGTDMTTFLKVWSLEKKVPHATLTPLLKGMARFLHQHPLPKDARTLLRTPRVAATITPIAGGEYWHRGLEKALRLSFSDLSQDKTVSLDFNVDGLSLFNRTTKQTWTILGKVFEEPRMDVFVIGLFYGDSKPKRIEEFLEPFVEETNRLMNDPIKINDKLLKVQIRCFVCNTPARAFLRATIGANSYEECLKCKAIGEKVNIGGKQQVSYPLEKADDRTDEEFRSLSSGMHPLEQTVDKNPLHKLDLDLVEDFIVGDSLHLLHLGIMKTYLKDRTKGEHNFKKWNSKDVETMDKIIQGIKLPCEFNRRYPTPIEKLADWNGREFATFLNYVGVAVLKEFLNYEEYKHFLNLFTAATIWSNNIYQGHLDDAQRMIDSFVVEQHKITNHIARNLHNITHITKECKRFGPLPQNSTYAFESFLHEIKAMVRHGKKPLQKLANRIEEYSSLPRPQARQPTYPVLRQKDIIAGTETRYSSIVLRERFTLKSQHFADCWLLTTSNKVVRMVAATNESIRGVEIVEQLPQFSHHLSDMLRVYYTNNSENITEEKSYSLNEVYCKLVAIKVNTKTVFIPLHHTLPESLLSCNVIPI